jgi:tRNA (guanine-N7-)-methyltransferase
VRKSPRLPLEELQPYLLELTDPPAPLDWRTVFGDEHPVELEIGFGKGLFLLTESQARPGVNFVGVEILRGYQLFTANRIAKRGLRNVRLACGDGLQFLRDGVASGSLEALHVYFPDPWWKTRHHKRRLFTAEFAAECGRVLRPGGRLSLATDVEEYAGRMRQLLAAAPRLRLLPSLDGPAGEGLTNFERKFRTQGRPIWRMLYEAAESEPG